MTSPAAAATAAATAAAPREYIYAIRLKRNKYFVGRAANVDEDMEAHVFGITDCEWTQLFPPTGLLEPLEEVVAEAPEHLNGYVKMYMMEYGIRSVRGGTYTQVRLPPDQEKALEQEFAAFNAVKPTRCYRCGNTDHAVKQCPLRGFHQRPSLDAAVVSPPSNSATATGSRAAAKHEAIIRQRASEEAASKRAIEAIVAEERTAEEAANKRAAEAIAAEQRAAEEAANKRAAEAIAAEQRAAEEAANKRAAEAITAEQAANKRPAEAIAAEVSASKVKREHQSQSSTLNKRSTSAAGPPFALNSAAVVGAAVSAAITAAATKVSPRGVVTSTTTPAAAPAGATTCRGITKAGFRCQIPMYLDAHGYCSNHRMQSPPSPVRRPPPPPGKAPPPREMCHGVTLEGRPCRVTTNLDRYGLCPHHRDQQFAAFASPSFAPNNSCYRCGRKGHWANDCFAKTDRDGFRL